MNNKESLTYILGAGASFQSIPLVNTFAGRFSQFIQALGGYNNMYIRYYPNKLQLDKIQDECKILLKQFEDHQSFDTFFKKLFHTQDIQNIKLYKKILNLYFIWEHQTPGNNIKSSAEDDAFNKLANVDKRYDALIAGLLQPMPGEKKLFCKTNFITWNYDLNLLSSIKNYFYPDATYKELFENVVRKNAVWEINDQVSILNMNGYFYSSLFDGLQKIPQNHEFNL